MAAAFTRGAVDLSALKARAAAKSASANPGGSGSQPQPGSRAGQNGSGGVTIIDVTEATFQSEVLERSLHTPVLVDFWAEWCGPCKQLSPILEKLAVEGNGRWVLAKVDVDANRRLAAAFRVQGIPMVYAIVGGQPVDAFTGVLPESQLRQWINSLLDAAAQAGVTGGGGAAPEPVNEQVDAAETAIANGDLDAAEEIYNKMLAESPGDSEAEAGLARVRLLRRTEGLDPDQVLAEAAAHPDDFERQSKAADVELLSGMAEQAYARLVDLVRRTSGEQREAAREHLVSLFALAAPDDPVVAKARRDLASALF